MSGALSKICGISTPEAVVSALEGHAAFVGFVFFPPSPRDLAVETAARLARPARGRAKVVAVTVDPTDAQIDAIVSVLAPDLIQLHGRESAARTRDIRERSATGVIKAISVEQESDLTQAGAYDGLVDHLMFDAKTPKEADLPGGMGARFDWSLLAGRRFQRPWFLAGGLDPWNVGEALRGSGAPAVDVSSGVERGPGLKDPALITAFLDAVRRA